MFYATKRLSIRRRAATPRLMSSRGRCLRTDNLITKSKSSRKKDSLPMRKLSQMSSGPKCLTSRTTKMLEPRTAPLVWSKRESTSAAWAMVLASGKTKRSDASTRILWI
ncbi:hypothetical protein BN1708_016517 [Verticillium longisporum]|uniref:Uncharacterized protein n=1 Tax=Verticillium longisporum TaxID=100787 RepID=A0A0G4MQC7_VERLO|nr:hypothetical protein BN1708_016517 [Verticillium longisporum]